MILIHTVTVVTVCNCSLLTSFNMGIVSPFGPRTPIDLAAEIFVGIGRNSDLITSSIFLGSSLQSWTLCLTKSAFAGWGEANVKLIVSYDLPAKHGVHFSGWKQMVLNTFIYSFFLNMSTCWDLSALKQHSRSAMDWWKCSGLPKCLPSLTKSVPWAHEPIWLYRSL